MLLKDPLSLQTANQIDHSCISKKFRRSHQDVRVKRGADAASDHHLGIANLRLKLKGNWTGAEPQQSRYDIGYLKIVQKLDEFRVTETDIKYSRIWWKMIRLLTVLGRW